MRTIRALDYGWGVAVFRVIMGLVLIITGHEKFVSGINRVTASMMKNQIPFARVMAGYITGLELIGGVLLVLGLGGRLLALLYTAEFLVVSFYVLVPSRGWMDARLPITLLAGALLLLLCGSGHLSLDALLGRRFAKEQSV